VGLVPALSLVADPFDRQLEPFNVLIDVGIEGVEQNVFRPYALRFDLLLQVGIQARRGDGVGERLYSACPK
jgi:hypothetical protein